MAKSKNYDTLLLCILIFGAFYLPVPMVWSIVISLVIVAVYAYLRRGLFYFARAAKLMSSGKDAEAWPLLRKAYSCGLNADYKMYIGLAYIRRSDDVRFGIEVLENVAKSGRNKEIKNSAAIMSTLGYAKLGEYEKAIGILESLRAEGVKDPSLYINLGSFYLETGNMTKAHEINEEAPKTVGTDDNRGVEMIMTNRWKEARTLYMDMLLNSSDPPKFMDAYLHGAQVALYYGDNLVAKRLINKALDGKMREGTNVSADYLKELLADMETPIGELAINCHPTAVALGRKYKNEPIEIEYEKPTDEELGLSTPDFLSLDTNITEEDERDINTDLDDNDEDLEYLGSDDEYEELEQEDEDIGDNFSDDSLKDDDNI